MRNELVFVAIVAIVGYGAYAGLYAVGTNAGSALVRDDGLGHSVDESAIEWGALASNDSSSAAGPPFNFRDVSKTTGFNYTYRSEFHSNNEMVTNAGVYATDYNNDGWTDLLAIGGSSPTLFENDRGQFHRSGVLPRFDAPVRAAHVFDYNDDGREDLLVLLNGRPPVLLENTGGDYERVDAGFNNSLTMPTGATSGDFNGDGTLDVFVYQYANWSEKIPDGMGTYDAPLDADNGNSNYLYLGTGSGFERTNATGIRGTRWSLAASAADFDGDGRPDIHVANDFNHDIIYENRGNGTFERTVLPEETNRNAMSSEVGDVNGDGRLDLFVANFYLPSRVAAEVDQVFERKASGNNLLINEGNGSFTPQSRKYGVQKGGWGWAAALADLDNDGRRDLFQASRNWSFEIRDGSLPLNVVRKMRAQPVYSYPAVWHRTDEGFTPVSPAKAGFNVSNGRGVSRLDFDHDGAVDLAVATTAGYRLYENTATANHAIELRVVDSNGSRALGADVSITTNNRTQRREVRPYTDFLSQDVGIVHVGVGNATRAEIHVAWSNGTERTLALRTDRRYVVAPSGPLGSSAFDTHTANGTRTPTDTATAST